jgi:hypothetical protein
MARFRKIDPEVMTRREKRDGRGRAPSPKQEALVKRMRTITDDSVVYEAVLGPDEKPATVRQQLLRAAKLAEVDIAVKKSPNGFYVGLMTPERRSRRGASRHGPPRRPEAHLHSGKSGVSRGR